MPRFHYPVAMLSCLALSFTMLSAADYSAKDRDAEISKNRSAIATITIQDAQGNPVTGASVLVQQTAHAFMLGCTIRADRAADILDGKDENTKYLTLLPELFNTVVFGNSMKWKYWEKPDWRKRTERVMQWIAENDLRLRGHTMIWQTYKYGGPMPNDVEAAAKGEDERSPEERLAYLRKRSLEHIRDIGLAYRDSVEEWDVLNEQVEENNLTKALDPKGSTTEAPIMVDWFKAAHQVVPEARLFINDYHIMVGNKKSHKKNYEKIITYLQKEQAPLSGIGFQGHFYNGRLRRTADQLRETFDRFATFGVPLLITEFDTFGENWGKSREDIEAAQAEYLKTVITEAFAHPAMQGIVLWGFWDGQHWANTAPLYRKDWTAKPALAEYKNFFFEKWWTNTQEISDDQGIIAPRVIYGDYDLIVTVNGSEQTFKASFNAEQLSHTITLP